MNLPVALGQELENLTRVAPLLIENRPLKMVLHQHVGRCSSAGPPRRPAFEAMVPMAPPAKKHRHEEDAEGAQHSGSSEHTGGGGTHPLGPHGGVLARGGDA